jgi:hypothetical protein
MARAANSGRGRPTARAVGPSANELAAMLDPSRDLYGVTENTVKGMDKLVGSIKGRRVNPFDSLPVGSDFYEAFAIFEDDDSYDLDDEVTAGTFYEPTVYDNFAKNARDKYDGPAELTVVPTSTTNFLRPRTVAAGYDKEREVLTVVFRDGLFYNYYNVSGNEWSDFKRAPSKGRFIFNRLDSKPRGAAVMTSLPLIARETLYRVVRTNQIFFKGHQSLRPLEKAPSSNRKPSTKASKPKKSAQRKR